MRTSVLLLFLLLFFSNYLVYSQDLGKIINGKVLSAESDVANVHIRNTTSGKGTITDEAGNFAIRVALLDTLVFSAVQFKHKWLVITKSILDSKYVFVTLEEFTNELDEVVLKPYDLSGDILRDVAKIEVGPIITETTLELPNAHIDPPTQNERKLYTARTWDFKLVSIKLDPLINYFSGRTKMLNKRVGRDSRYANLEGLYDVIPDSIFISGLLIPKNHIYDFLFYCETDVAFDSLVEAGDKFEIWRFLRNRSVVYRENNDLD